MFETWGEIETRWYFLSPVDVAFCRGRSSSHVSFPSAMHMFDPEMWLPWHGRDRQFMLSGSHLFFFQILVCIPWCPGCQKQFGVQEARRGKETSSSILICVNSWFGFTGLAWSRILASCWCCLPMSQGFESCATGRTQKESWQFMVLPFGDTYMGVSKNRGYPKMDGL